MRPAVLEVFCGVTWAQGRAMADTLPFRPSKPRSWLCDQNAVRRAGGQLGALRQVQHMPPVQAAKRKQLKWRLSAAAASPEPLQLRGRYTLQSSRSEASLGSRRTSPRRHMYSADTARRGGLDNSVARVSLLPLHVL